MKFKVIATALLLLLSYFIYAQEKNEKSSPEETYLDANSYFFFEDYEEALALYQQVIREIPKNSNLNYRIGICYLNIPGKRSKAIPFLESATANVSKSYNENSIKEKRAPLDAYFFLGSAYLANNQLSKAKEAFLKFKSLTNKRDKDYDANMLTLQVGTVTSSEAIQKEPINFILSNLGSKINDRFSNFSATLSYNGQVLAYTSKRKFYQAVYVTRRSGDEWAAPENITPELETDQNLQTLSLSYDGTELYLYKDDNRDGNIYVSHYRNGRWNPIESLGPNINTKYWEASACISPDGKTLYFSSNREGGFGELDLYKSNRLQDGTWGPAQNLGATINSKYNETNPSVTGIGSTLFFASDGFLGVGGYDIYFSNVTKGNQWSTPENLGYPLNTTDDDVDFKPIEDGQFGLLSRFDADSYGEMDLFKVEVFSERYNSEVVLYNQYEARRKRAGEKFLVIDTVNTQKMALILPDGVNLDNYTAPDKKVKLYFNGNRYDLRDKVNLMASRKATITEAQSFFSPSITQGSALRSEYQNEEINKGNQLGAKSSASNLNYEPPFLLDSRYQTNIAQQLSTIFTDIFKVRGMPIHVENEFETANLSIENQAAQFYKIFKSLGINIPDSIINSSINRQVVSPAYLMAYLLKQKESGAISSDELLIALTSFLDKLAVVRDNNHISYSKAGSIKKEKIGSSFIGLFNLIKSKASGKLKLMLDSIDPESNQINSFDQLIAILKSIDEVEFQNYKAELISIMAEISAEEFYSLNAQSRNDLIAAFKKPSTISMVKYGGMIILSAVVFLIILFLVKKRNNKKNRI